MPEIVNPYQKVSSEALKGVGASEGLSDQLRLETAGVIADALVRLADESPDSWDKVRWQAGRRGTHLINILRGNSTVRKVIEAESLPTGPYRQKLIDEGMQPRAATAVTYGSLKTAILMLQMSVDTFDRFRLLQGRSATVSEVEPGATHSTRSSSAVNTRFTSLMGKYNSLRGR